MYDDNSSAIGITSGSVTASGNTQALFTDGSVSAAASPYKYRTNTSSSAPETGYTLSSVTAFNNSSDTYKYVEIISCPDVYVGNVKVSGITSGNTSYWLNNSGSITDSGATADNYNVKYNESAQTLTLNGAQITSYYSYGSSPDATCYGIYAAAFLDIVLADDTENTIDSVFDSFGYGVSSGSSLTISGGGSLTISDSTASCIWAERDVKISGGTVSAAAGADSMGGDGTGIAARYNVMITGGNVTATGGEGESTGGKGIYAGDDLLISGGTVSAVATGDADGIYVANNAAITGGTVSTTADSGNGICVECNVQISGGILTAAGGASALIYSHGVTTGTLTLPASYGYKSNTEASDPGGSYTYGTYIYSENDKYLKIATCAAPDVYVPSRTITVTETSSHLFDGAQGAVRAEANMTSAFSNSIEVRVTDTDEAASEFGLSAGNTVYPFDISLYIKGTNTKTEPASGYAVRISLPVSDDLLDVKEQLSIAHKADDGTVTTLSSSLKQIDGVWYLVFESTDFSPYALIVNDIGTYNETSGLPYYIDSDGNIFIGFAARGKYIAPYGVTVRVKENAKNFTDTGSHWAKEYIGFVTEREIFLGTGSGAFTPDSGMTRAMFAAVIGRLYERSYGEIEAVSTHAFTDCDYDDYYGKYVDWAAGNGIIGGYGNGKFGPGDLVTREQMAAILYRFANFLGVMPSDMDTELSYPDAGSISSYAASAALYCQSTGIITGRGGGNFVPRGTATRAEVATIIQRFVESVLA
ncbi:MAG: S-layer homology domain-containing protein [Oscillospiraceae bacterium]|nr:S-layer homology domain-containing protein [Oscillospiraceae bacterium]